MARTTKATAEEVVEQDNSVNVAKRAAFDEILKQANKEIKSDTGTLIARLGDRPMDVKTISSGSLVVDSITGGGFPVGRLIEIYGAEASGKTSMALTAAGNVQKNGGNVAYIDLENALDPKYAKKLGVDIDSLAVAQPESAEQALTLVFKLAKSGVVDLIVVDSIASLVPKAELEGDVEQQTIGLLARLLSRTLRQLIGMANKTDTTVIFINQTRDNIGGFSPFGTPQTTPGGKAMKFYASQRLEVKRIGQVKDGKDIIGNEVKVIVKKNKIAPPFMEGVTVLTYNKGINKAAEMIEVGADYGVIGRPNNRTYIETETGEVIATSKAAAVERLEQSPEILERLSVALQESINNNLYSDVERPDNSGDADSDEGNDVNVSSDAENSEEDDDLLIDVE